MIEFLKNILEVLKDIANWLLGILNIAIELPDLKGKDGIILMIGAGGLFTIIAIPVGIRYLINKFR